MENNDYNMQEDLEKEKLLKTIKMEPIIEKTEIKEEIQITNKKKKTQIIDFILIGLIVIIVILFVVVLLKL